MFRVKEYHYTCSDNMRCLKSLILGQFFESHVNISHKMPFSHMRMIIGSAGGPEGLQITQTDYPDSYPDNYRESFRCSEKHS